MQIKKIVTLFFGEEVSRKTSSASATRHINDVVFSQKKRNFSTSKSKNEIHEITILILQHNC